MEVCACVVGRGGCVGVLLDLYFLILSLSWIELKSELCNNVIYRSMVEESGSRRYSKTGISFRITSLVIIIVLDV